MNVDRSAQSIGSPQQSDASGAEAARVAGDQIQWSDQEAHEVAQVNSCGPDKIALYPIAARHHAMNRARRRGLFLSLIHISEPTRLLSISYAVFCLKKKKKEKICTMLISGV